MGRDTMGLAMMVDLVVVAVGCPLIVMVVVVSNA